MKQKRTLIAVLFMALFIVGCVSSPINTNIFQLSANSEQEQIPVTGSQIFKGCGGPIVNPVNTSFEQAIIEQTNEIRMQNGLPPLKHVLGLDESARYHVADMNANNYFNHDTLNRIGSQLTNVCNTWNRIEKYYNNWQALGENIAAGQHSPEMAMDGWMNSPEHKDNILNANYAEIGVGFYEGKGDYRFYWDQNFGRRDGVYPLVIDGEKAQTRTNTVPVYIYGAFSDMRLKTDNGAWGKWQPFANNLTWNLPNEPGQHTVTAEMRGQDGHITSSDSIELLPTP